MDKRIVWISRTAVLIALMVVLQAVTAPLGYTLLTGSVVNLMLVVSVMTCGLATGLSVSVIAPIVSKLLGIGPLWGLIPFIALGNIVLALLWHVIGNRKPERKYVAYIIALVVAAAAKFLVLYTGIVRIAVPVLLGLPEKQAAVISGMYSYTQIITALIGGAVAIIILPTLKKAIKR